MPEPTNSELWRRINTALSLIEYREHNDDLWVEVELALKGMPLDTLVELREAG